MSSLSFLISELQALATETRRRYPDVREASDKAVGLLRANPSPDSTNVSSELISSDELLKPVFLGCTTKNAKVIVLALGALQRLIALKAVPLSALPQVTSMMAEIMAQGVDIQLRILQALLSLVTHFPEVHGDVLGDVLLLCFRLQESRIAVVSSTAAATLRQLVMYIFEKLVKEDSSKKSEVVQTIKLPDGTSATLTDSEVDAYRVFEDLCLLANMEQPNFLKLESLPKTFALELIESVLTNYHGLFHRHPETFILLQHHLSPLLLKSLSERPTFPLTLRATRVAFILLKQFYRELETEAEVFAMILVKIISGEETNASDGTRRPHWMRVLAAEVIRGLCADADLMRQYWERYDANESGSKVFTSLITALKRLVTEKPAILGVNQQMQGLGIQADGPANSKLEHVAGMVANAASTTVSGALGMHSTSGLSVATSTMKIQCIDQLDKAEAPMIPEGYIYMLGLQCLVSIAEGFASSALPAFAALSPKAAYNERMRLPPALKLDEPSSENPIVQQLKSERQMIEESWPALLAALSFLMGTNLSDELFANVLAALQALTNVSGVLGLQTPRDAFLTSLSKLAIPARVVTKLDSWVEPSTPRGAGIGVVDGLAALAGTNIPSQPPALSDRNIACLKVLIYSASFLGGSLASSWFNILETLQNADYVLTGKGTKSNTLRRVPSLPGNMTPTKLSSTQTVHEVPPTFSPKESPALLTDVEPEHVLGAIQSLFESTRDMDSEAFNHFTLALCKLSAEMIGMQVSTDVEEAAQEETNGVPLSPTVAHSHRRRVSGIQLSRTLRSGDFSISKLGIISLLNINRLIDKDPDIAWNPITSHLMTVLQHPLAPSTLRLQAAQKLDDVLLVIPRNLAPLDKQLIAEVQTRTLNVLAGQVLVEGGSPTVLDIRRMGLETLHSILQTGAHTLLVGWETILEMLGSVCRPITANPGSAPLYHTESSSQISINPESPKVVLTPLVMSSSVDRPNLHLVRNAFQSLTLVCDNLSSLSTEQLKLCISTLGLFGRQTDTNIALTAAESLLWAVSDSIQLRRRDPALEPQYSELWMFLLAELLVLCTDARPEVRGGSIQTLFRTIQLYGTTLSLTTWDQCMWQIIFPLLDALKGATALVSPEAEHVTGYKGAWDESKILAWQSIGSLSNDFLMSKLIQLEDFEKVWDAFVERVQDSVIQDTKTIGTVALRSVEKSLKAFKEPAGVNKLIAEQSCERVWETWEKIGQTISHSREGLSSCLYYTQESLVAFVDVVKILRVLSRTVRSQEWSLERLCSLTNTLKTVMTYPFSVDYRPDIDALTPLQGNLLDVLDHIDLSVAGAPSLVLSNLAFFMTLAFTRAFDTQTPANSALPGNSVKSMKVTYIAVCKKVMPVVAHLYLRYKRLSEIYADGTVEAILSAYALPIKLKYDCPAPSKFGSDLPLWKIATTNFLIVARDTAPCVANFSDVTDNSVATIWKKMLEVFEGALLADCSVAADDPIDEAFDYAFISAIEEQISPHLGNSRIPNDTIKEFGKILQHASKLYEVGTDGSPTLTRSSSQTPVEESIEQPGIKTLKQFSSSELHGIVGKTIPTNSLPRERFSYWCFDLLFLLCSSGIADNENGRRRVAALCIPMLLSRMTQVLLSFCLDIELHGEMPLDRTREEEVIYVLRKMLSVRMWTGSLWASQTNDPSQFAVSQPELSVSEASLARELAYRSERAHLFHCYTLLLQVASAPKAATAWLPEVSLEVVTPVIQNGTPSVAHFDSRDLARSCLQLIGEEMGLPRLL
ncbi:hypothetical protein CPB86DRAFT_805390 [Serendipita vermifera]|nr:hypothetical protein CPB86DRAFT_805390 [Serendipita vermifera]